ncbi:MAG: hypothetical protein ACRDQ2_02185 [Gaiellales bacterium]
MFCRVAVLTVAAVAGLSGCGQQNSYDAAEDALRDWLTAVRDGDPAACDLMTTGYRREMAAGSSATTCEEAVAETAGTDVGAALPEAGSAMEVPVWDPSGEALVEIDHARSNGAVQFWMKFEDGKWLVAGDEAPEFP